MNKKARLIPLVAMAIVISSIGVGNKVSAATLPSPTTITSWTKGGHGTHSQHVLAFAPMVLGTVSAVDGNMITVVGVSGTSTASTTFSIDATNAKIFKGSATSTTSISAVQVGDTVRVRGNISSTSGTFVTATSIIDGVFPKRINPSRFFQGVRGTVSSINGSSLTVNSKDGKTYTVDASIAKITEFEASTTASRTSPVSVDVTAIKVGDKVMVQGTVSGTTVTAKKIIDGDFSPRNAIKKSSFRRGNGSSK